MLVMVMALAVVTVSMVMGGCGGGGSSVNVCICCHSQFPYSGTGKRFTGARLCMWWVTEVLRGSLASGLQDKYLPLCGLETLEYLKIEFYELSGPFQKYI